MDDISMHQRSVSSSEERILDTKNSRLLALAYYKSVYEPTC